MNKMAPQGPDQWLSDYRAAEQLGQEIMELINERNRLQRQGTNHSRVAASIRVKLQQFTKEIKRLKDEIMRASSSYLITPREAERRQYQIDQLISREKQLNQAFKPTDNLQSDYGRSGLLNDGFDGSRDSWSSKNDDPGWGDLTPENIRTQQQQLIKDQDKGLDELSKVIQRQKMMGHAIGDEVDYQNDLIDDITGSVDSTEKKLIRETHHVERVSKKSGTCAMLVVVVLLLIAIIVVAVVPVPK